MFYSIERNDLADTEAKRGSTLPQLAARLDYIMAFTTLVANTPSPPQGMTAIQKRVSTEYLPTWSIHTAAGRVIGPEIGASRWHSCAWAILHCWRPTCTASDVETPPLVYIAMVLMRRQSIWCYTAQHTTRRSGSHGQISTPLSKRPKMPM